MPQFPPLKSGIIISPTSQDLGRITLVDIFPGGSDSKESVCNVGDPGSILGRIPGEENGNPPQNSCQEKSHGWRSLLSYSPWSHRESDMTERLAYTLANGLPSGTGGKEPTCQCRRCKRCRFDSWIRKIPWRRKWQPTPVSYLANPMDRGDWWAPWGHKESDMTEYTHTHAHIHTDLKMAWIDESANSIVHSKYRASIIHANPEY